MTDLYGLDLTGAHFSKACGGSTHPDGEACLTLAKIGPDAWATGDGRQQASRRRTAVLHHGRAGRGGHRPHPLRPLRLN